MMNAKLGKEIQNWSISYLKTESQLCLWDRHLKRRLSEMKKKKSWGRTEARKEILGMSRLELITIRTRVLLPQSHEIQVSGEMSKSPLLTPCERPKEGVQRQCTLLILMKMKKNILICLVWEKLWTCLYKYWGRDGAKLSSARIGQQGVGDVELNWRELKEEWL